MSQGLFTASSGIAANQARIDVIADNIANMNTVGFKSSQINFETVFSRQLSAGSPPTGNVGGINPREIGLGVTVSEIGKNFSSGSIQTTGRSTDLNIQGEGFFCVRNYNGEILLTRAGNFTTDSNGYLVNPQGNKVVGTSVVTSTSSSTTDVQVPTKLNLTTPLASATTVAEGNIGQLSGSTMTSGTFTIDFNGYTVPVGDSEREITSTDTITSIVTNLNTSIADAIVAGDLTGPCTASFAPSTGVITIDNSTNPGETIDFGGGATDTSNFLSVLGFSETGTGTGIYTSAALYDQSQITIADADDSSDTYTITNMSISSDGALEATYSNGAKLTVVNDTAGLNKEFKYISAAGREISNTNIDTTGAAALTPAQLQIQLATVINPKGLTAEGGNLFGINPVSGAPTYAIGRAGGLGVINSGSLEAANVDLPAEFSNMILAQRGIEANSRTFEVQNQILRTIVNLGR